MVSDAVGERVAGGRPSLLRSLGVASIAAIAVGAIVYKALRSGGREE